MRQDEELLRVLGFFLQERKSLIDRGRTETGDRVVNHNDAFGQIEILILKLNKEIQERDGRLFTLAEPFRWLTSAKDLIAVIARLEP